MKMRHAAIFGLSATALICAPLQISAKGVSPGLHTFHFGKFGNHFRHAHHRNFNQWSWYGGYYEYPPYAYDNNNGYAQPSSVVYMLGSPPARSCQYIRETVTVPSESGGTRDITVTRC